MSSESSAPELKAAAAMKIKTSQGADEGRGEEAPPSIGTSSAVAVSRGSSRPSGGEESRRGSRESDNSRDGMASPVHETAAVSAPPVAISTEVCYEPYEDKSHLATETVTTDQKNDSSTSASQQPAAADIIGGVDAAGLSSLVAETGGSLSRHSGAVEGMIAASSAARMAGSSSFPAKLHQILSDPDVAPELISWLPHGRAFKVHNQAEFEKRALPQYFRHGRFASFLRQVNGWGFRRVLSGTDENAYFHEYFLRGLPQVSQRMKRTAAISFTSSPRQGSRQSSSSTTTLSHLSSRNSISSSGAIIVPPDFYRISKMHPLPEADGTWPQEREAPQRQRQSLRPSTAAEAPLAPRAATLSSSSAESPLPQQQGRGLTTVTAAIDPTGIASSSLTSQPLQQQALLEAVGPASNHRSAQSPPATPTLPGPEEQDLQAPAAEAAHIAEATSQVTGVQHSLPQLAQAPGFQPATAAGALPSLAPVLASINVPIGPADIAPSSLTRQPLQQQALLGAARSATNPGSAPNPPNAPTLPVPGGQALQAQAADAAQLARPASQVAATQPLPPQLAQAAAVQHAATAGALTNLTPALTSINVPFVVATPSSLTAAPLAAANAGGAAAQQPSLLVQNPATGGSGVVHLHTLNILNADGTTSAAQLVAGAPSGIPAVAIPTSQQQQQQHQQQAYQVRPHVQTSASPLRTDLVQQLGAAMAAGAATVAAPTAGPMLQVPVSDINQLAAVLALFSSTPAATGPTTAVTLGASQLPMMFASQQRQSTNLVQLAQLALLGQPPPFVQLQQQPQRNEAQQQLPLPALGGSVRTANLQELLRLSAMANNGEAVNSSQESKDEHNNPEEGMSD